MMSQGFQDVLAERQKQIRLNGYSSEHDAQYVNGELSLAAISYADPTVMDAAAPVPKAWPWQMKFWRPRTRRENLVRAAALIIAEIDREDQHSQR